MSGRNVRLAAAIAAVVVAGSAQAQWWRNKTRDPQNPQNQPGQTQPGQTPGQTQQQPGTPTQQQPTPTQPQQGSTGTASAQDLETYGSIRMRNHILVQMGELAQQRGTSQQVKDLGRKLETDHRRTDREMYQLLQERGMDVEKLALPESERAQHDQDMARLRSLSGDQFDKEFVRLALEVTRPYVDDLKDQRNRTPGSDARLKKWLDDTENLAEADLTAARRARDSLGMPYTGESQRAARRPAPAPGR